MSDNTKTPDEKAVDVEALQAELAALKEAAANVAAESDAALAEAEAKLEAANEKLAKAGNKATPAMLPDRFAGLDPDKKVNVVTTGIGAMPVTGLVQEGQSLTIPVSLFSRAWMKPAAPDDAKVINPWLRAKDNANEDQRAAREKRLNALAILKG